MTDKPRTQTPFVLGKPIKNPADFYGRQTVLRELYQAVLNGQLVAVVGEHRCGNTSIIYQLLHPDVREHHLAPAEDAGLVFAFVSSQLAAQSPHALLRRISRALRRADPDAAVDYAAEVDQGWLEDYLEDLSERGKKLVLLMDEFESIAKFPEEFWEWFQVLVSEYDISIVASTRHDLGRYRAETGEGPPFFNHFVNVMVGSFSEATFEQFLREKSELTDFDFMAVRDVIFDLAGRYPYYLQLAAALFYLNDTGSGEVSQTQIDDIVRDFKVRTSMLFDDAWHKLPENERQLLTWMVLDMQPAARSEQPYVDALESLTRRGYALDGKIFSSAFAEYILQKLKRVGTSDAGFIRMERELIDLGPDAAALLRFLMEHNAEVLPLAQVARAVWLADGDLSPADANARLEVALRQLTETIDAGRADSPHLDRIEDDGIRFRNAELSS